MSDEAPPLGTWRRWLWERSPTVFLGYYGSRLMGTMGLLADAFSDVVRDAVLAPFHHRAEGPAYDSLRYIGEEQRMPIYPGEDWPTYRDRLIDPWSTWERAATPGIIVDQLAAAGLPGAQVFRWAENGSGSEFVVWYGAGTHPVTGVPEVGAFTIGDGTILGPIGLTIDQMRAYRDLINHWKPADWICRHIIFEISGWTIGSGHIVGEAGLLIGGEQVRMGTL